MADKSSSKVHSTSSGLGRMRRAKRALMRLTMKLARFEKHKAANRKTPKGSKRKNYDTAGLIKHMAFLEGIVKAGRVGKNETKHD